MIPSSSALAGKLRLAVICVLVLAGASTLAGAASGSASSGRLTARLSKASFTASQASSVKLVYKFSTPSKTFSYLLTFKKGAKWQMVKSVKKRGNFRGSKSMTVKKVFAGKAVKLGSYRLKLSADKGSKLLSFKVVKAPSNPGGGGPAPTGSAPDKISSPTIIGAVKQGTLLSASQGGWSNSPSSYAFQWRRCDGSGASCSDISGATTSSYVLVSADVGSTIRVAVKASNTYGSTTASSDQTAVVWTIAGVSGGSDHTCAVLSGGTVKCWGTNDYGQLGDGTTTDSSVPVQVSGITTAVQVSAGSNHTCAVLSDHTVKCWGYNDDGELGNGTSGAPSSTPVQVLGIGGAGTLSNVSQVSAGEDHTCAVLSDHTAACWGYNGVGELGDGTTTDSPTPVQVTVSLGGAPFANVAQVSAGSEYTCAVLLAGTVYCWGYNGDGQLGNGGTADEHSPHQVSGLTGASEVSARENHTCALSGGAVWCWGDNSSGQLGNGSSGGVSSTPVQVKGISGTGLLAGATQVSVGADHSCALLSDRSVNCWGDGNYLQLGNNSFSPSSTPVHVAVISNGVELGAGLTHTCAVLSDTSIRCWGNNFGSQLGVGKIGHSEVPISVSDITTAAHVSAGSDFSCAVKLDGTVWCWGSNDNGQLGDNSTSRSSIPVQVSGLANIDQVSAGYSHACARRNTDGSVWCWGDNSYGQLGNNTSGGHSATPVQVVGSGGTGLLTGVSQVSAGGLHTCAVRPSDHTIQCWGYGYFGQLGNGTTSRSYPVQVSGFASDGPVSAGYGHTCALKSDQTVWCWGRNDYGQLGNGLTSSGATSTPAQVKTSSSVYVVGATAVSAGFFHSCAVAGGSVYCWGHNYDGELGHGPGADSPYAVLASDITTATQLSAGGYHSCALLAGNTADCWGHNYEGELGIGSLIDSYVPAPISLSSVLEVSAGGSDQYRHTCAVISGGAVKCWGSDYYGQLGDGGVGALGTPVWVVGF